MLVLAPAGSAQTAIPCEFSHNVVWLKVNMPGQARTLDFLLDTGAAVSVLDLGSARGLGVKLGGVQAVSGVGGMSAAYEVDHFAAEVGGVRLPDRWLAVNLANVSRACGRHIDGLIGADFLRRQVVQIDFAAGRIRFLTGAEVAAGSVVLPARISNGCACVQASIDGVTGQWLRIDTGCDKALLWAASSSKAAAMRHTPSLATTAGSDSASTTTTQLCLGGRQFDAVETSLRASALFPGEAGLVGNRLLSKFRLTLDFAHRRVVLDHAAG